MLLWSILYKHSTYVIIAFLKTIVREASKAANIWNNPPLMKDLTPIETKKFYDTVGYNMLAICHILWPFVCLQAFLLCPQLKSARHLLTTRLSRSLINRRQFLRRSRKIPMRLSPRPVSSDTLSKSWKYVLASTCMYIKVTILVMTILLALQLKRPLMDMKLLPLMDMKLLPLMDMKLLHHLSLLGTITKYECNWINICTGTLVYIYSEPVRILKEATFIAKGIFLKMNTEGKRINVRVPFL